MVSILKKESRDGNREKRELEGVINKNGRRRYASAIVAIRRKRANAVASRRQYSSVIKKGHNNTEKGNRENN